MTPTPQARASAAEGEEEAATRAPRGCCEYARQAVELAIAGTPGKSVSFRIHCVSLGPIALVGMEGEIFSEYQLSLCRTSPFARTVVIGYCNGCVGYIPTAAEAPWGGYEVVNAHRPYGQMHMLNHARSEPAIMAAANQLLTEANQLLTEAKTVAARKCVALGYEQKFLADVMQSDFSAAHDTYNSIGTYNGFVYYVLSSADLKCGAKLFRLSTDPASTSGVQDLGDLTTACGDTPGCVVQGKAHVPMMDGGPAVGLVLATHVGYYAMKDGMETLPTQADLPAGVRPYPGGCVLSYLDGQGYRVHCRVAKGEGILSMAIDAKRKRAFFLTWPSGYFGTCALLTHTHKGEPVTCRLEDYVGRGSGEAVHPDTGNYRCVCRSLVVDPGSGAVYFTNALGDLLCYASGSIRVTLKGGSGGMRRDYFGQYPVDQPGHMAYHWRAVAWWQDCIVGVHGNSGYLFRISALRSGSPVLEILERLTSRASRRLGMGDQFSYGYLGFAVDNGGVIHYLTGSPIGRDYSRSQTRKGEAKGLEYLHLITYDLKQADALGVQPYRDRGAVFYRNRTGFPTYVNSIALATHVDSDGVMSKWVYALARITPTAEGLTDVIRFRVT